MTVSSGFDRLVLSTLPNNIAQMNFEQSILLSPKLYTELRPVFMNTIPLPELNKEDLIGLNESMHQFSDSINLHTLVCLLPILTCQYLLEILMKLSTAIPKQDIMFFMSEL